MHYMMLNADFHVDLIFSISLPFVGLHATK